MKEKILELKNQGKSYSEIAKILNCSKGTVSFHCDPEGKEKANQRKLKHRANKLRKMLNGLNPKCQVCGYDKCFEALDFHHTSPKEKTESVAWLFANRSVEICAEEVKKCVILCCRCHRELHAGLISL